MPPRHAYWTIIVDGQPTSFRAHDVEELLPTFNRLREKHPDAQLKWFERGQLWESRDAAREQGFGRGERRWEGPRPGKESDERPRRDAKWRPGGEHRDPKQRYKDANKAKWDRYKQNIRARWEEKQHARPDDGEFTPPHGDPMRPKLAPREPPPEWRGGDRDGAPQGRRPTEHRRDDRRQDSGRDDRRQDDRRLRSRDDRRQDERHREERGRDDRRDARRPRDEWRSTDDRRPREERRDRDDRHARREGDRKPWERKPATGGGARRPWGTKPGGERKPWGDRPDRGGGKKPWGSKPGGPRKPWSAKPTAGGQRKPFGNSRSAAGGFRKKPFGSGPARGPRGPKRRREDDE